MQLISKDLGDMAHENTEISGTRVKQERVDEHEINQLAVEMVEKNRQKMITQAAQIRQQNQVSQQSLQRAGGQQMITFYFNRDKHKKESGEDSIVPKKLEEKKKGTLDEESVKGRFGWTLVHNKHIPYLFRHDERHCAVRMVETQLLNKYLNYLPHEITTCIHVRSYFITDAESKLLNEINGKHCEFQFGKEPFTTRDLVVKVTDAKCFYRFLDTCYKKLVQKSAEQSEYCGFVRINGESVVPYTVKTSTKYVPLFYFEGETDTLKLKAEKIEGWELAYLKFCCKVQGIRNELFASDTCSVVSLDDVKQYFPRDTQFEDWWPQKTAEPMRIVHQGTKPGGNWTQRPPMPPQTQTQVQVQSSANSVISSHNSHSSQNSHSKNHSTSIHKAPTSIASALPNRMQPNMSNNMGLNIYSQWAAASLVNGQAQQALAQAYANANYSSAMQQHSFPSNISPDHVRRLGSLIANNPASLMQNISSQSNLRPPPLVRSTVAANNSQTYTSSSRIANTNLDALRQLGYVDQSANNPMDSLFRNHTSHSVNNHSGTMHASKGSKAPPPLIPVNTNGLRSNNLSSHDGVGRTGIDKQKLAEVPSFRPDPTRSEVPYKVRKMTVENKAILCINNNCYSYNEQNMVAVHDIIREFFPSASISECTEVLLNVLSVTVYKANVHQVYALKSAWGTQTTPDVVPLIKASDLSNYLTQIKYIFQKHQTMNHQRAKRVRT